MAIVRAKQLYGYRGHHYPGWRGVKIGEYVWGVYKFYASKHTAEIGLRGLKMWRNAAPVRLAKTTRGWAVVQRSIGEQYWIKATDPNLYLAD